MKKHVFIIALVSLLFLASCDKKDTTEAEVVDTKTEVSNDVSITNVPVETTTESDEDEMDVEANEVATMPENILTDADLLAKAEEDLKNLPKFKGKDLYFFQDLRFYGDGRIYISMQDPDNPENIDEYVWQDGTWGEPMPVQISGDGDIADNVVALSEVSFATANKVYNTWKEKQKEVEGATEDLTYVYYTLWVPNQTKSWRASSIEGTRAQYDVKFDANGDLVSFEKQ